MKFDITRDARLNVMTMIIIACSGITISSALIYQGYPLISLLVLFIGVAIAFLIENAFYKNRENTYYSSPLPLFIPATVGTVITALVIPFCIFLQSALIKSLMINISIGLGLTVIAVIIILMTKERTK